MGGGSGGKRVVRLIFDVCVSLSLCVCVRVPFLWGGPSVLLVACPFPFAFPWPCSFCPFFFPGQAPDHAQSPRKLPCVSLAGAASVRLLCSTLLPKVYSFTHCCLNFHPPIFFPRRLLLLHIVRLAMHHYPVRAPVPCSPREYRFAPATGLHRLVVLNGPRLAFMRLHPCISGSTGSLTGHTPLQT